jgi:large repetitive protein
MTRFAIFREHRALLILLSAILLATIFANKISAQNSKITLAVLKDITVNCENMVNILPAKPYAKTTCLKLGFKYIFSEQIIGNCPKTILRTWTVSDSCGATTTAIQKITLLDKTPPTLFNIPSNVTLSCGNIPLISTNVTAKDKCDNRPIITVKDTKYDEKCIYDYKIRREYTAKDACGNASTRTQIIVIKDDKAPIFSSKFNDVTVSCSDIPAVPKPTATDNCSKESEILITLKETKTSAGCKNRGA